MRRPPPTHTTAGSAEAPLRLAPVFFRAPRGPPRLVSTPHRAVLDARRVARHGLSSPPPAAALLSDAPIPPSSLSLRAPPGLRVPVRSLPENRPPFREGDPFLS